MAGNGGFEGIEEGGVGEGVAWGGGVGGVGEGGVEMHLCWELQTGPFGLGCCGGEGQGSKKAGFDGEGG